MKKTFAIISLGAALCAGAQNLSTEITVDRTVQPVENTATPLQSVAISPFNPGVQLPLMQISEFTADVDYAPSSPDTAYADDLTPKASPYKGYVSAGYFPVFNLGAQAGYRLVDTQKMRLDARARYAGNSYWSYFYNDKGDDIRNTANTLDAGLSFARAWNNGLLDIDASYLHSWLQVVGRPAMYSMMEAQKFGFNNGNLRVAYHGGSRRFTANTSLSATYQSVGETEFFGTELHARLWFHNVKRTRGFELGIDALYGHTDKDAYVGYYNTNNPSIQYSANSFNSFAGMLTPAYRLSKDKLSLRLGIRTMWGYDAMFYYLTPIIDVNWRPSKYAGVFASYESKAELNTLAEQYALSPCAVTGFISPDRLQAVLLRMGFNVYPLQGLTMNLQAVYGSLHGQMIPATLRHYNENSGAWVSHEMRIYGYADYVSWGAEGTVSYKAPVADIAAEVKASVFPNGYPVGGTEAFDRAKFILRTSVQGRPIAPLLLRLDFHYRNDRLGADGFYRMLEDYTRLDLSASYRLSERLDVFLSLNNLTDRRNELTPFLYSRRLNGLAGLTYRF